MLSCAIRRICDWGMEHYDRGPMHDLPYIGAQNGQHPCGRIEQRSCGCSVRRPLSQRDRVRERLERCHDVAEEGIAPVQIPTSARDEEVTHGGLTARRWYCLRVRGSRARRPGCSTGRRASRSRRSRREISCPPTRQRSACHQGRP
jgi:hypothetical protein